MTELKNLSIEESFRQQGHPDGETGILMARELNRSNAFINKLTIENMQVKENDKVLEIGFSNGKMIPKVLEKAPGVSYYGIDISETMVTETIREYQVLIGDGTVNVKQGSVEEIPFPDNYFNHIFSVNSLPYWQDTDKAFYELYRVLQPGGLLYLASRTSYNVSMIKKYGIRLYSLDETKDMVEKAGFKFIGEIYKRQILFREGGSFEIDNLLVTAVK